MVKWYNKHNDILLDDLDELLDVAQSREFGESEKEDLISFLLCESFECRMDPERSRAFHLAAMIISRVLHQHLPKLEFK